MQARHGKKQLPDRRAFHHAGIKHPKATDEASAASIRSLNQQFVRENAQAIDCRRFDSQNNWAKRDWLATVTARELKLRRGEIAFGPDQHQDAAGTMLMLTRIIGENLL